MLTKSESADDYKEVTDAEKAALEKSDAEWVEPSEYVKDVFNNSYDACYNPTTGFLEANGLKDITAQQGTLIVQLYSSWSSCTYAGTLIRTNLLGVNWHCASGAPSEPTAQASFCNCINIEIIRLRAKETDALYIHSGINFVNYCNRLRKIIGIIVPENQNNTIRWDNAPLLESFKLRDLKRDFSIKTSKNVTLESLDYLVSKASNTTEIAITLHPEAYARLTEDLIAKATEKNITFTTPE